MSWQTLDGRKPFVAERLRRLREELAAREGEHTDRQREMVTPTDTWIDGNGRQRVRQAVRTPLTEAPYISPVLRAYLDKLIQETAEAEKREAEAD